MAIYVHTALDCVFLCSVVCRVAVSVSPARPPHHFPTGGDLWGNCCTYHTVTILHSVCNYSPTDQHASACTLFCRCAVFAVSLALRRDSISGTYSGTGFPARGRSAQSEWPAVPLSLSLSGTLETTVFSSMSSCVCLLLAVAASLGLRLASAAVEMIHRPPLSLHHEEAILAGTFPGGHRILFLPLSPFPFLHSSIFPFQLTRPLPSLSACSPEWR